MKPKIDSEQLPLKSKSVEVDSAALRNLKETGKFENNESQFSATQY